MSRAGEKITVDEMYKNKGSNNLNHTHLWDKEDRYLLKLYTASL